MLSRAGRIDAGRPAPLLLAVLSVRSHACVLQISFYSLQDKIAKTACEMRTLLDYRVDGDLSFGHRQAPILMGISLSATALKR